MMKATSTLMSFPPIKWWEYVAGCGELVLDTAAPFRKMSWQNRYRIATANGPLLLSVPLIGGRSQRSPMKDLLIEPKTDWQKQHWRSIFSAYGRAPFFEYYGPELEVIFATHFVQLSDFNRAAFAWAIKALKLDLQVLYKEIASEYHGAGEDLRAVEFKEGESGAQYLQVFQVRNGFIPNLSIIDLLMNEGPAAKQILL